MALYSPSAIPSEPPSSSSSLFRRRKYDVYLSFSCNDTRKNFADPLYEAMKGAEINVFRDDTELQVGESISEKLLKAIECSGISIIIFSKDYAASRRCLEEVEKIYECWKTFLQPVIPIIYKDSLRIFPEEFGKHYGRSAKDKMKRFWFDLTGPPSVDASRKWCIEYEDRRDEKYFQGFLALILEIVKHIQENWVTNGRQIGNLYVSDKEIAKGSNGTIVYEGTYSCRVVAVKCLLKTHNDVAYKEIDNLIKSDQHQNIVRLYGVEKDQDFVYLALQQCTCCLADLIQIYSDNSQNTPFSDKHKVRLDSVKNIMGDIELWTKNGQPLRLLLELMRDVVSGLVHLHELKIIHRDIQPQNVLIMKEKSLRAKLSGMGISKHLHPGESSLGTQATVCGTSGWKAPERLREGERQTSALDLFSLGCVLFFCITGGGHPFGKDFERDYNIVYNKVDLSAVKHIPEAEDLFSHLLNHDPELRPKALQVFHHPLFWKSKKRLSFVRDTSDMVKSKARETNSNLLTALENIKPLTFDAQWNTKMNEAQWNKKMNEAQWNTEMDKEFIDKMKEYRDYNFNSVQDLLRIIRNTFNHYRDLPEKIKAILGSNPEGLDDYFASRFPNLLIEVWKVVINSCQEEKWFHKYFKVEFNSWKMLLKHFPKPFPH